MSLSDADIILRPVAVAEGKRHYVLVTAISNTPVAGPFVALGDAVLAARQLAAQQVAIWHEQVDDRGRVMGPPLRLFSP